ncbi:MAG TPA: glycosyltransferase [Bryobacteraceae bacterium]|nr:glycosyltransferase [Bryobacteraceae bacterium]
MKVAFFSPLPPAKSGIADYSAALLAELKRLAEVTTFTSKPELFDPTDFDVALYQIGNNPYHDFCYEAALKFPGVVVIHEANLHHLIAEITIKRGDWDAYLRELEYDGGPAALAFGQRVRALQVGPDYEGVPMLRRLLQFSRGVVVHSECVATQVREAGFAGPIAKIPHGAWIPTADRLAYRHRLGLDETTPLIGTFGFLKPYKRIAESLRALRRLIRFQPNIRMILVGEPHPELCLGSLIQSLDLGAHVRVMGFTPIEDFVGLIAACDIVLNLRFPTVGENSGTLMRSLGLGKAVVVSNVGSFCELPDDVCLKTPVDASEEDHIFEYLNLLVSRPEIAQKLGSQAQRWVERECNWPSVADRYVDFLDSVLHPRPYAGETDSIPALPGKVEQAFSLPLDFPENVQAKPPAPQVEPEYIQSWATDEGMQNYIGEHLTRLAKTLQITPPGGPEERILEMGSYLQITPALKTKLGYGEVRACYYGKLGKIDHKSVTSSEGETFETDIELFDAEKDSFPYADAYFSTILCCELIEHLFEDPMHMMSEVNRTLKPGGHLVLTTPNIGSLRAISAILQGYHPGFFPAYIRPARDGFVDARHNREYTPREIMLLFLEAGFETVLLETGEFLDAPRPEHQWVFHLLERYRLSKDLRGDGIYAVGRKKGPIRERYPQWLYN